MSSKGQLTISGDIWPVSRSNSSGRADQGNNADARGSKPGERRGGRQRATPNRRTLLTNRILAAAANPAATAAELVVGLAKDQALPADTRMAIARKAAPFSRSRSTHNRSAGSNGHRRPPS